MSLRSPGEPEETFAAAGQALNDALLDFLAKVQPDSLSTFFAQDPLAEGTGTEDDPLKFTVKTVEPGEWVNILAETLNLNRPGLPNPGVEVYREDSTEPKNTGESPIPSAVPGKNDPAASTNTQPTPVPLPRRSKNSPPAPGQMPPPQQQQQQPPADKSSTPLSTGPHSPEVQPSAVQQKEAATAEPVAMDTKLSCTSPGLDSGSLNAMRYMDKVYSVSDRKAIKRSPRPAEYDDYEDSGGDDNGKWALWKGIRDKYYSYLNAVAFPRGKSAESFAERGQELNDALLDFLAKLKPDSLSTFFEKDPLTEGTGTKDDPLGFTVKTVDPVEWVNVLVEILDLNRPGLPSLVAPTDRQSLLNSMAQEDIFWAEVLSGRNYPSRSEPTEPIKKKPRPAIIRNPTLAKLAKKYPGLTPKIHGP